MEEDRSENDSENLTNGQFFPAPQSGYAALDQAYSMRLLGFTLIACGHILLWPFITRFFRMGEATPFWMRSIWCMALILILFIGSLPKFKGHARFFLHLIFALYSFFFMQDFNHSHWGIAATFGVGIMVLSASLVFIRMTDFALASAVLLIFLIGYPGLPWEQDPTFSGWALISTNLIILIVFAATVLNWRTSPVSEQQKWQTTQFENAWKDLFQISPSAILIVDPATAIMVQNQAAIREFGFPSNEIKKMRLSDILKLENTSEKSKKNLKDCLGVTLNGDIAKVENVKFIKNNEKIKSFNIKACQLQTLSGKYIQVTFEEISISSKSALFTEAS